MKKFLIFLINVAMFAIPIAAAIYVLSLPDINGDTIASIFVGAFK